MISNLAVQFENVSKTYPRNSGRVLLRAHLNDWLRGRSKPFYAVKDLTFQVERGESVAVLGANGAGKSTLLSLTAGLAAPDRGRVLVYGKVSPLLELGSGFHPDLTGAENINLNASLLGNTRKRTKEIFGEILEFAELCDFLHEPLRTYSTGMVMRLAFSIAITADPDILIIDEVLAVGDSAFQAKCLDKIRSFRHMGKTILCVSHAAGIVQGLCERGLWLDRGELMLDGPATVVLDAYEGRLQSHPQP